MFVMLFATVYLCSSSLLSAKFTCCLHNFDALAIFGFPVGRFFFSALFLSYFFSISFSLPYTHTFNVLLYATDCVLYAVGKPVYHKSTNVTYGSWLKDSHPRNKEMAEKIWTTYETHHNIIYEFADKTSFRNNQANDLRLKSPGFQVCSCFEMLSLSICVHCFMCVHVCLYMHQKHFVWWIRYAASLFTENTI